MIMMVTGTCLPQFLLQYYCNEAAGDAGALTPPFRALLSHRGPSRAGGMGWEDWALPAAAFSGSFPRCLLCARPQVWGTHHAKAKFLPFEVCSRHPEATVGWDHLHRRGRD